MTIGTSIVVPDWLSHYGGDCAQVDGAGRSSPSADGACCAAAEGAGMALVAAARRLKSAQHDAHVEALAALLHPRVVGAGPDGTGFGKEDDLERV